MVFAGVNSVVLFMISGLFTNIVTRLSYTPHQELTTKNSVHTLPVSYIFLQWFQLSTGGCCLSWHLKRHNREGELIYRS